MKILLRGSSLNSKYIKICRYNFNYNTNLNRFSTKSTNTIENEIMNSYSLFSKTFNLRTNSQSKIKNLDIDSQEQHSKISFEYIRNKYYENSSTEVIDEIIKAIYREEVMNIKKEKTYDDLLLFIKNCIKYNYPEYISDVKYFKNKEIKNFMTNTNLLESQHQFNTPFSIEKEFEMKIKVQNLYKLRKGEKGEKIDPVTEKEFEVENYKYMNFLAETSKYEKLNKFKLIEKNNSEVLKEFSKGDNLIDRDLDVEIKDSTWKNHYIDYYMKKKKKERKESLGASILEEDKFKEELHKNADKMFSAGSSLNSNIKIEHKTLNQTSSDRYIDTDATSINDGVVEPYPYYDKNDYPMEELFDESQTLPGKDIYFAPLKREGEIDDLPPKLSDYFEDIYYDMIVWGLFTYFYNQRLFLTRIAKEIRFLLNNSKKNFTNFENSSFGGYDVPYAQSLVSYYNLLPKWAREHPSIKMVVRGLEKQPWASYSEKINMINLALQVVMKKDKYFNEILEIQSDGHMEDINSQNLQSLLDFDDEKERNILQDPEDEATDDDEMEVVSTADEVRAIEKEEEDERKKKKKEEGRAKRAAEEAKNQSSEAKGDKSSEDKKKMEAEKKKDSETENAYEDMEEAEDVEDSAQEDKTGGSNIDSRILFQNQNMKSPLEKDEERMNLFDDLRDKLSDENPNDQFQEEDFAGIIDNDKDSAVDTANYKEQLETFKKSYRESRITKQTKKEKLLDIIKDIVTSTSIKIVEEKLLIIRKNLEDASIRYQTDSSGEVKLKEIDYNKDNLVIYPLSLINCNQITEDQKELIKKVFEKYIEMASDETQNNLIKLDEDKQEKSLEDVENEIMQKISKFESTSGANVEGFTLDEDYKESLKDTDVQKDLNEEIGLTDAYFKPLVDLDKAFRTEDPIPFDYYINEDGFWDDFISFKKSRVDIKQFTHQPMNTFRVNIRKKTDII